MEISDELEEDDKDLQSEFNKVFVFKAKLASLLNNIRYTPFKADPDVWIRPAIKSEVTEYYKYDLIYVDNVLVISCVPMKTN